MPRGRRHGRAGRERTLGHRGQARRVPVRNRRRLRTLDRPAEPRIPPPRARPRPRRPAVGGGADGPTVRIDTAKVTTRDSTRRYVAVASCGFDSEVNEAANAMSMRIGSTGTYVAAPVKTLSRFPPALFTIDIDGVVHSGAHMLVAIGNSTSYGGGMKVTPNASVVDGQLDACMLAALGKGAFLRAFPRVFRGTHVTNPAVTMARGKRIHIETDRHVMVYADGERVGPTPATVEVEPSSLSVFVGPNARAVR